MKHQLSFFVVVTTSIMSCFALSAYGVRRPPPWWERGPHPYAGHFRGSQTSANLPPVKSRPLNSAQAHAFFNYFLRKGPQPNLYYGDYHWGPDGWEQERRIQSQIQNILRSSKPLTQDQINTLYYASRDEIGLVIAGLPILNPQQHAQINVALARIAVVVSSAQGDVPYSALTPENVEATAHKVIGVAASQKDAEIAVSRKIRPLALPKKNVAYTSLSKSKDKKGSPSFKKKLEAGADNIRASAHTQSITKNQELAPKPIRSEKSESGRLER